MSNVKVNDKSGGVYEAMIEFTYGECERLPFNLLRRIGARLETVPDGGLVATADFNIRQPEDSAAFLEILGMFGEGGTYLHGSAADPEALALLAPPEGLTEDEEADDDLELEGSLGKPE